LSLAAVGACGSLLAGATGVVGVVAVVGGLAAFHQFVRVGRLAMVGGTAGVVQDVPPFCMVQGSPPATLRGLNRIGMMRNGATEASFIGVKQAYRLMFRRGMTRRWFASGTPGFVCSSGPGSVCDRT